MSGADSITVEAAFISANAASYIASTYTATLKGSRPLTLALEPACLRSLNAFLDYFLAIVIKDARSTDLPDLKATLARVLDSALGFVALNEAQAELETYRNQESVSMGKFDRARSTTVAAAANRSETFDVEGVWLQARVRCMIYSTVGEKEESDFPSLAASETAVTPPVAIFLTAILEFLGEHILLTSARFARERLGGQTKGLLTEDDLDRGIRLDKVLATIWHSYLTILPGHSRLRKKASAATVSSTPERVFNTLPFSQTTQPESPLRQQTSSRDASRVAPKSPGLRNLDTPISPSANASTFADNQPLLRGTTSQEAPTKPRTMSMDVSPLVPTKAVPPMADARAAAAAESTQPPPVQRTFSTSSSLYATGQTGTELAEPLVSTGLWSKRDDLQGGAGRQKTLWNRTNSESKLSTKSTMKASEAITPTPAKPDQGFESGVFQYNVQRSSTPITTPLQLEREEAPVSAVSTPNGSKSPFREVYDSIYAEQMRSMESPDLRDLPAAAGPVSNATVVPRKSVQTSMAMPKIKTIPNTTEQSDKNGNLQGLGIRDMQTSNIEPGSDYETFIKSEMARSRDELDGRALAEAESRAQRARILANRAAVLASQTSSPRLEISTPPLGARSPPASSPIVQQASPSTPGKRRQSNSVPRPATTAAGASQTLLLAEFLRSTGPERSTPRAVPLMSLASPKITETSSNTSTLSAPHSKPPRVIKAHERRPIDSSGTDDLDAEADDGDDDDDDDDTESWDEALYGPRPGAPKSESMADFLRNVPPPADMLAQSPKVASSKRAPKKSPKHLDDALIAGPIYDPTVPASPPTHVSSLPPQSAKSPKLSSSQAPIKTTLGRSVEKSTNGDVSKSPSSRSFGVFQQRAVSRGTPDGDREDVQDSDDDDDDDDSIYGNLRRRPAKKESLADFLKNSTPPGQTSETASPETSSSRPLSKMSKRISSLSILVGGINRKNDNSASTSATGSPNRPNHRPLVQ